MVSAHDMANALADVVIEIYRGVHARDDNADIVVECCTLVGSKACTFLHIIAVDLQHFLLLHQNPGAG